MFNDIVKNINSHGIVVLEDYYTEEFCDKIVNDFDEFLIKFKNKVEILSSEDTGGDNRIYKFENYSSNTKIFSQDELLVKVAGWFYNQKSKSHFVIGGKVEHSNNTTNNSGGGWHKDNQQPQFKSLLYLTDVNEKNGPYLFLPYSNQFHLPTRDGNPNYTRYSDDAVNEFCEKNELEPFQVTGKKGTVVLTNTSFIHRGKNIEEGERYSLTNYYFEDTPLREQLVQQTWGDKFIENGTHI